MIIWHCIYRMTVLAITWWWPGIVAENTRRYVIGERTNTIYNTRAVYIIYHNAVKQWNAAYHQLDRVW